MSTEAATKTTIPAAAPDATKTAPAAKIEGAAGEAKKTEPAKVDEPAKKADDAAAKKGEPAKEPEKKKDEPAKEWKLTLPEGLKPDEKRVEWFSKWAQEKGIAADVASELVAENFKQALEDQKATEKAHNDALAQQETDWKKSIESDPVYGGKNLPQSQVNVQKVFAHLGAEGKAAYDSLEKLGVMNEPALFRFFAAWGAKLKGDDSAFKGSTSQVPAEPTPEQKLAAQYPKMRNPDGSWKT